MSPFPMHQNPRSFSSVNSLLHSALKTKTKKIDGRMERTREERNDKREGGGSQEGNHI